MANVTAYWTCGNGVDKIKTHHNTSSSYPYEITGTQEASPAVTSSSGSWWYIYGSDITGDGYPYVVNAYKKEDATLVKTATISQASDSISLTSNKNLDIFVRAVETYSIILTVNPSGTGTVSGGGVYAEGSSVTLQAYPNQGYEFINWTDRATGTEISTLSTYTISSLAGDKDYLANFQQSTTYYSVSTAEGNYIESISPSSASIASGNSGQFIATPYTDGWNAYADATGKNYQVRSYYSYGVGVWSTTAGTGTFSPASGSPINFTPSSDATIKAWGTASITATQYRYKFTYDANGGTGTAPDPTYTGNLSTPSSIGQIDIAANTFTKEHHTFSHWNTASNGTGITYTPQQGGQYTNRSYTLYAQWTEDPKTNITCSYYDTNINEIADDQIFKCYNDDIFSIEQGKKSLSGYTFHHSAPASDFTVPTYENVLYYYTPVTYSISYDNNGGTGTISPTSKQYNVSCTLSNGSGFSKSDNRIKSWNTKADGSGTTYALGGTYTANASTTLYAQWEPPLEITVVAGTGGTVTQVGTHYVFNNESYTIDNKVLTFKDTSGSTITCTPTASTGYTTVDWDKQSGTFTTDTTLTCSFKGNIYRVDLNYNGGKVKTGQPAPANPRYAQYGNKYKYNWDSAGTSSQEVSLPSSVLEYNTTPEHYNFDCWTLIKDDTATIVTGDSDVETAKAHTLYVHWDPITYTIKFSGATQTPTPLTFSKAESWQKTIPNTTMYNPIKENYFFKGWDTKEDGTGIRYIPSDNPVTDPTHPKGSNTVDYTSNKTAFDAEGHELTLYAIWELDPPLKVQLGGVTGWAKIEDVYVCTRSSDDPSGVQWKLVDNWWVHNGTAWKQRAQDEI